MSKQYHVAILGVTGAVGQTMLNILEAQHFPVAKLYPLATERSAGKTIKFKGETLTVIDANTFDFSQAQIGLFSAGGAASKHFAPIAAKAGCVVIDNTSYFRQDHDVPLVIPEVNAHAIADYKNRNIIANPNCSTIQMLVALKPIHDAVGISRINVVTYQSVSGTGREAIETLRRETHSLINGQPLTSGTYPTQIAFNLIPHIDDFESNGYTREEMKMVRETKKILQDNEILVNATAVRVPVYYGHSEAIHIETKNKLSAEDARRLLSNAPGVIVKDEQIAGGYPTPAIDAQGSDAVFVGRIREDISHPLGLNLWVVSDNIRKGAALNSIQIAQRLVSDFW